MIFTTPHLGVFKTRYQHPTWSAAVSHHVSRGICTASIPNYSEPLSVLRETLHLLSMHPLALTAYHPILAMEAREKGSVSKAIQLVDEFSAKFLRIGYTITSE